MSSIQLTDFRAHWPRRRGRATISGDIFSILWLCIPDNLHNYNTQYHRLGSPPVVGNSQLYRRVAQQNGAIRFRYVDDFPAIHSAQVYGLAWPADLRPIDQQYAIPSTYYFGTTTPRAVFSSLPYAPDYAGIAYWLGVGNWAGVVGWTASGRFQNLP
jgi:hypothetical protein